MSTTPDLLLIGHMTADLTPQGRTAGGTVSYAARTAAAFGLKVAVLTSAAPDEPLLDAITPYADVQVVAAGHTTTFENIYTPQGRIQYIRGLASSIYPADVPSNWLNAPYVHLAPIANEIQWDVADLFPDATVLLTLQGWLRRWNDDGRVRFKSWHDTNVLKHIDIVVFSEEDIAEAPHIETDYVDAIPHVFVTRAERGGTHYQRGSAKTYATPQVAMVHPTGAGDIFAASVLGGLHVFNGDFDAATQLAAHLAANSVTRTGLDSAPSAQEVTSVIAQLQQASNNT